MMFPKRGKKRAAMSQAALVKRLDVVFSTFIRLRDADSNGMCRCITCFRGFRWNEGDAGHFVSRDRKSTRWNEKNVNAQCPYCNRYRSGEQFLHGKAIDQKYGPGTADALIQLGKTRSKIPAGWLMYHIDMYLDKVKELRKRKCL